MNKQVSDKKKNLIKYLLIGFIVGLASRYIPRNTITNEEVIMIGSIASITFGILDMYSPSIKINVN
jgi:uncharacterized membrane protein YraQ (UPF0718 family)